MLAKWSASFPRSKTVNAEGGVGDSSGLAGVGSSAVGPARRAGIHAQHCSLTGHGISCRRPDCRPADRWPHKQSRFGREDVSAPPAACPVWSRPVARSGAAGQRWPRLVRSGWSTPSQARCSGFSGVPVPPVLTSEVKPKFQFRSLRQELQSAVADQDARISPCHSPFARRGLQACTLQIRSSPACLVFNTWARSSLPSTRTRSRSAYVWRRSAAVRDARRRTCIGRTQDPMCPSDCGATSSQWLRRRTSSVARVVRGAGHRASTIRLRHPVLSQVGIQLQTPNGVGEPKLSGRYAGGGLLGGRSLENPEEFVGHIDCRPKLVRRDGLCVRHAISRSRTNRSSSSKIVRNRSARSEVTLIRRKSVLGPRLRGVGTRLRRAGDCSSQWRWKAFVPLQVRPAPTISSRNGPRVSRSISRGSATGNGAWFRTVRRADTRRRSVDKNRSALGK